MEYGSERDLYLINLLLMRSVSSNLNYAFSILVVRSDNTLSMSVAIHLV